MCVITDNSTINIILVIIIDNSIEITSDSQSRTDLLERVQSLYSACFEDFGIWVNEIQGFCFLVYLNLALGAKKQLYAGQSCALARVDAICSLMQWSSIFSWWDFLLWSGVAHCVVFRGFKPCVRVQVSCLAGDWYVSWELADASIASITIVFQQSYGSKARCDRSTDCPSECTFHSPG